MGYLDAVRLQKILKQLRWFGTGCIIVAAFFRAIEWHSMDIFMSLLGAGAWGYVAYEDEDKALLTVNAFIFGILLLGLFV